MTNITPDWITLLPSGLAQKLAYDNGAARARAGWQPEPNPYLAPELRTTFERGFWLEYERRHPQQKEYAHGAL